MKMGMAEPGRLSRVEFEIQRTKAPYGAFGTWRLADAAPARPPGDAPGARQQGPAWSPEAGSPDIGHFRRGPGPGCPQAPFERRVEGLGG
jgi:hypothetical protein